MPAPRWSRSSSALRLSRVQAPLIAARPGLIGGSEAVQAATRDYWHIRVFSAPLALLNYVILGWLIGIGRAGFGLALQIVLNGVNIALSICLVHRPWLGRRGRRHGQPRRRRVDRHRGLRRRVAARTDQTVRPSLAGSPSNRAAFRRLVRDQPRHHDPHIRAAFRLRVLHGAVRQGRRRRSCRQRDSDEPGRRSPPTSSTASPRQPSNSPDAPSAHAIAPRSSARFASRSAGATPSAPSSVLPSGWRAGDHRPDDDQRGRSAPPRGEYLWLAALFPVGRHARLPDGRRLHRRDLVDRHAQHDVRRARSYLVAWWPLEARSASPASGWRFSIPRRARS